MAIERTKEQIEEVHARVIDKIGEGSTAYPGMSYEEGIDDFVRWLTGESDGDGEFPFEGMS